MEIDDVEDAAEMPPNLLQTLHTVKLLSKEQRSRRRLSVLLDRWLPWRTYWPWTDLFVYACFLWTNPDRFEEAEHVEEWKQGPQAVKAFEMGVVFGIEYEQAYPTGRNDEWPIPLDERPSMGVRDDAE